MLNGFSHEFLSSLFSYDELTGLLKRRVSVQGRGIKSKAGSVVGSVDGKGYLHVMVQGRFIRVHRLVYFLFYKLTPIVVDHRDHNKLNNKISNLRGATVSLNNGNIKSLHAHNTSGYRGVSKNSRTGLFHATIKVNGKSRWLGRYTSPIEAAVVYNTAAKEVFGEFARFNDVK